jgi:uncharacterized SAM-binding protein YcdF (DUF218 family)
VAVFFHPSRIKRARRLLAAAALGAAALGLAIGAPFVHPELLGWILVARDPVRPVDAVFVLSGDVDFHRTAHGARLFRESGARWLIVSGAGIGGDSAAEMARAAEQAGVPAQAILVEPEATTTRANVVLSRPLLAARGIATVGMVTSAFHARRAVMAARRAWPGVTVLSWPAPDPAPLDCAPGAWTDACRARARSEWKKLLGYLVRGWL